MAVPARPKIYHIVHVDRLSSIITDGCLWCDEEILRRALPGTPIGMNGIKQRRLTELTLTSYPDLHVGDLLLKKSGTGNLFMVFGEPDVD